MEALRITIGRGVYIHNPLPILKQKIHNDLHLPNADYLKALEYGGGVPPGTPSHVFYYKRNRKTDELWTPRGYIFQIRRWAKEKGVPIKLRDRTIRIPYIYNFKGKPRLYQKKAITDILSKYPCGILQALPGAGKTFMGLKVIKERAQKTIILVHSVDLLYQWAEEIEKLLDEEPGLIGDGNFSINPITVGVINSVANKVDEISNKFGQVICDECHRVGAPIWYRTLQRFPARYYLGLSATPYRSDNLTRIVYANIGPKLHQVSESDLIQNKNVLRPTIIKVPTQFWYPFRKKDYARMITALTNDSDRNNIIASIVKEDLRKYNDKILITSDRVGHCNLLNDMFHSERINSEVLSGRISKRERRAIVDEVKNGSCKVLIATTSLIGEGFDCPELSALILATPIKFQGRVLQTIGRVLRPKDGKQPRIYDIRDDRVMTLKYSGYNRARVYKNLWKVGVK